MRKYSNENNVAYNLLAGNGNKMFFTQKSACYSELRRMGHAAKKVEFKNFRASQTDKYTDFYLKYVAEMLGLEYELTQDSFILPTSPNNCTANLILGTLVRMLFEGHDAKRANKFFEDLKNGKSKYRNKLKRFCDFYSRMPSSYVDGGHNITSPNGIAIVSTKDFETLWNTQQGGNSRVNAFFEGKYKFKK